MPLSLQISFRHCASSDALTSLIREKAGELERFYSRIISCHVVVEGPSEHHRQGNGSHFRVRVEVAVPGATLVASRDRTPDAAHEDAFVATNEAFHAIRRQLQDYARQQRHDIKSSVGPPHGRVTRLHREENYGFLETADGREIYFHRNSVIGGAFDHLYIGSEIRFAEEAGDDGAQASTVELVGTSGRHELPPPSPPWA